MLLACYLKHGGRGGGCRKLGKGGTKEEEEQNMNGPTFNKTTYYNRNGKKCFKNATHIVG